MLNSYYREIIPVRLPQCRGRQKYMHTFDLSKPVMAEGFEDYLDIVKQLCSQIGAMVG